MLGGPPISPEDQEHLIQNFGGDLKVVTNEEVKTRMVAFAYHGQPVDLPSWRQVPQMVIACIWSLSFL